MSEINLYTEEKNCCGCGGCMNICPKNAICMAENAQGFVYPQIDREKCIECGLCGKACGYQNEDNLNEPICVYAAATENTDILKSASGGAFASLAKAVLQKGGIVYGSAMVKSGKSLKAKHIGIDSLDRLPLLQGSKYVQSDLENVYSQIKSILPCGKQVLFSGTPCQVAGLRSFLGKAYDNLLTVDIICHGVPSGKLFGDYIEALQKQLGGEITDFVFRDKTRGWGLSGKVTYIKKGKEKSKIIYTRESSYYYYFLSGAIYRESCYDCKYAAKGRVGDITLGDYWGIENMHPEYLSEFDVKKGISCLLVNTEKGEKAVESLCGGLKLAPSDFEKASANNDQLKFPSKKNGMREGVLEAYSKGGYEAVEKRFKKRMGFKLLTVKAFNRCPDFIKKTIKKAKGK